MPAFHRKHITANVCLCLCAVSHLQVCTIPCNPLHAPVPLGTTISVTCQANNTFTRATSTCQRGEWPSSWLLQRHICVASCWHAWLAAAAAACSQHVFALLQEARCTCTAVGHLTKRLCHSLSAPLPCCYGMRVATCICTACTTNPPTTVNGQTVQWQPGCVAGAVGNTGICTGTCPM
jgi:hypothetical protein